MITSLILVTCMFEQLGILLEVSLLGLQGLTTATPLNLPSSTCLHPLFTSVSVHCRCVLKCSSLGNLYVTGHLETNMER